MRIILFIGNSRWHWATENEDEWMYMHTSPDLSKLEALNVPLWAWAAVGSIPKSSKLNHSNEISTTDIPLLKLPNWIGVDRALGAWGALKKAKKLGIVNNGILLADAGTVFSLTKISSKGEFQGGQLAPGLKLQIQAMSKGAKNLKETYNKHNSHDLFPIKTDEAMQIGSLYTLIGLLIVAQKNAKMKIWLCGGDSKILYTELKNRNIDSEIYPNLVLEGMIDIKKNLIN